MNKFKQRVLVSSLLSAIMFSAGPSPIATATAVPIATATPIPTSIPIATATPTPTSIPIATATPTPTPVPIATPTATPTSIPIATPTAVPIATATPIPTSIPIATPSAVPTLDNIEKQVETKTGIKLDKTNNYAFMIGTSEGKFEPNRSVTRAEVMVMLSRVIAEKMDNSKTYSSNFIDITGDEWYSNAIGYMTKFGIISGYEDGSFRPNKTITRAEFAAILAGFETFVPTDSSKVVDVKTDHWAAPYINSLVAQGFVNGYEDGTFRPDNNITRAEAAVIINRILGRKVDKEFIETNMGEMKTFTDMNSSHWAYSDIIVATNTYE